MKHVLAALCITCSATGLFADVAQFETGQTLMITAHYDDTTNSFSSAVKEGERTACFVVRDVTSRGLRLSLVAGTFTPWWADVPFVANDYEDLWFNSETYKDHNPQAAPLSQLQKLFSVVEACPGDASS